MLRRRILIVLPFCLMILAALACTGGNPNPVIYITATAGSTDVIGPVVSNPFLPTLTPSGPTPIPIQPTPNPTYPSTLTTQPYTVQAGDTLMGVSQNFGVSFQAVLSLNPGLTQTSLLQPGQVLNMPGIPQLTTPDFKLIPDSELVNSPGAKDFNVDAYINMQPGFIRVYSEIVEGRLLDSAQIIQFFASSASVNPRLLVALLEYRSRWVSNPVPSDDAIAFPMGLKDNTKQGLFEQLSWAVNQLNEGYYGFKQRGVRTLQFPDNTRLAYAPDLNPGTVGVQYFLSRTVDRAHWQQDVSPQGFFLTYLAMFGDPFRKAVEPLVPANLTQPPFQLPFPPGQTWYFTAGPHGGWDAYSSGWAALDFAPPPAPDGSDSQPCYVSPWYVTAISSGLIVRSGDGVVEIDTDMDGDERTGWVITYLHIADQDRIKAGTVVQAGTSIGHPSCEGFYLNAPATHVHITRRYNGEWMAADCWACLPGSAAPPFVLDNWTAHGDAGQAYQGWLDNHGDTRTADQGRDKPHNQISW